jgi:hypothetical protein
MRRIVGDSAEQNRTLWLRDWVSFRPAVERQGGTKPILVEDGIAITKTSHVHEE